jgi:molybdopterin converting factor small subunit
MEVRGLPKANTIRVQLEVTPALASVLRNESSGCLVLEKDVAEGATIGDLLADLAVDLTPKYSSFHDAVFDPDTREVSDQVIIILNENLMQFPYVTDAKLSNGDRVMLAIVFGGG